MSWIQIGLVLGSILLLGIYSAFLRSTLRDRALAILLFVAAVVAILVPDLTTAVARVLGVGRGTDLLFYLFVLGAVFGFIVVNARVLRLEDQITELVRELALSRARKPKETVGEEDENESPRRPPVHNHPA